MGGNLAAFLGDVTDGTDFSLDRFARSYFNSLQNKVAIKKQSVSRP
jgi:hypothetical protein